MYLVLETSSGNYPVLLTSKTRVAQLAKQSIPRLELLSGVILARLASSVKEALQSQVQIDKTYLWLDSKAAIYWIKGSKEWKQFVQNRVNEILSLTEERMWHYCPGTDNPADIGRESAFKLKSSQLWWKGPSWLSVCHQTLTEDNLMEEKKGAAKEIIIETVLLTACKPNLESCIPITISAVVTSCSVSLHYCNALCET